MGEKFASYFDAPAKDYFKENIQKKPAIRTTVDKKFSGIVLNMMNELENIYINEFDKLNKLKRNYLDYTEFEKLLDLDINLDNNIINDIDKKLHKSWWANLSTLEKLRNHPREFLSYGTFGTFVLSFSALLGNIIMNRNLIAPDFGVSIVIISMILWLMTQVSKFEK